MLPKVVKALLEIKELIRQRFHPKQHQLTAKEYREQMHQRLQSWRELTGIKLAA